MNRMARGGIERELPEPTSAACEAARQGSKDA